MLCVRENCFKRVRSDSEWVRSDLLTRDLNSLILENVVPNDWLFAFSFEDRRFWDEKCGAKRALRIVALKVFFFFFFMYTNKF